MFMILYKLLDKVRCLTQKFVYKLLFKKQITFGKKSFFKKGFKVIIRGEGNLKIGNNTYFNCNCSVNCLEKITIGNDTKFGEGVKIYDHNHKFRDRSKLIDEQGYSTKPIHIGDNCWIGSNVVILQGVTIGDNVTIGANCLIHKDVPSNSLVMCSQELKIIDL